MKIGPTKEEQLEAINAELLEACRAIRESIRRPHAGKLHNDAVEKIVDAIAKAEVFKNQQP